jgi:AcrR family transcriptional regulator
MPAATRSPSDSTGFAPTELIDDGVGHRQLAEIQRGRIILAMVEVASERGVGDATIARVVARSGVSRRTFYELFDDREDCFCAAFEHSMRRMATRVVPAYLDPLRWRERVRAGLAALLEFLEYEPALGRLVIVETLGAGPKVLERRRRVLAQVIAAVDQGRRETPSGKDLQPLTAEGTVGGALSLIHTRMAEDWDAPLRELLNPLVSMVVLPYLGPAAARAELRRKSPKTQAIAPRPAIEPLRDLGMRLTYRTTRVLLAIGAHPGASNRGVADSAGIRDQGQVSKLLSRLEQLGLIHNGGDPVAKGEPNAWMLTARGVALRDTLEAGTAQVL